MLKDVFIWGTSFPGLTLSSIEAQRTEFVVLFTHGRRRHYAHPGFRVHDVVDVVRGAVTSACPTTARKRASAWLGEKECHRAFDSSQERRGPCVRPQGTRTLL